MKSRYQSTNLSLICLEALSGKYPMTTDTLTPAFSKTLPVCDDVRRWCEKMMGGDDVKRWYEKMM